MVSSLGDSLAMFASNSRFVNGAGARIVQIKDDFVCSAIANPNRDTNHVRDKLLTTSFVTSIAPTQPGNPGGGREMMALRLI